MIINPYRYAGGVTPAWSDSIADPATDLDTNDGFVGEYIHSQEVTADQTGDATKVRMWVYVYFSATNVKIALYDNSGDLLDSGGAVAISATGYHEVTLGTPVAVTASTVYRVVWQLQNHGLANTGSDTVVSGSGWRVDFGSSAASYASFPYDPDPATDAGPTKKYAAGIYIE